LIKSKGNIFTFYANVHEIFWSLFVAIMDLIVIILTSMFTVHSLYYAINGRTTIEDGEIFGSPAKREN
jgi:hypothetical protein